MALPEELADRVTVHADGRAVLQSDAPLADLAKLGRCATDADLAGLDVRRPSLEDVYLNLTRTGPDAS